MLVLLMVTFAAIIGVLTVTMGILVKIVGFPDQIRKNYQRKSTEGLSDTLMFMSVIGYSLWVIHGVLQGDWVLILGQGLGVIMSGIIVFQIIYYRKK